MFYRLRERTINRTYSDGIKTIGYVKNIDTRKDIAVDNTGAVFLKALSRSPRSLSELTSVIVKEFIEADPNIVEHDAADFYAELEKGGFIVSGETVTEIDNKDKLLSNQTNAMLNIQDEHTQNQSNRNGWSIMETELGGFPRLNQLQVEITHRCNERCVHCYIPPEQLNAKADVDIDSELFKDVLSQCRDIGLIELGISGGEPMLHNNFIDFLRIAKEYDFIITVYSNLTAMNNEILSELKFPRISLVKVSLYSLTPSIHDGITKIKGSFEKTMNGIHRLIDNNIPIQINCPILKSNKNSISSMIEWGKKLNISFSTDYEIFANLNKQCNNLKNRLTLEELEEVMPYTLDNDPSYLGMLHGNNYQVKRDFNNERPCGACRFNLSMSPNGDIYPCTGWQNFFLGNVKEQSLQNIWEKAPKVSYLRNLRRKDFPKCLTCNDINFCHMCLFKNATENTEGDIFKLNDYFCKIAALKHRLIKEKLQIID